MPTRKDLGRGPRGRDLDASMGPRRCRRGRLRPHGSDGAMTNAASMGPRRCRRGRLSPSPSANFSTSTLQWGRVVADAEGRRSGPRREAATCFNGAASLPTRKGPRPDPRRRRPDASMGPRRCRRGREVGHAGRLGQQDGFNGAASLPTRKVRRSGTKAMLKLSFNGAASLPTRKASAASLPTGAPFGASMGPRRCRRGRCASAWTPHRARGPASMGPRRCRRGRGARGRGPAIGVHDASMGPRRCRRGRALKPAQEPIVLARLQWGRVVADAEGCWAAV